MAWERPNDLLGEILEGRYELLRLLGEGGMGAVYEARHIRLDSRVAVKVLRPDFAQDERQRKRFLREARAANLIQHDNVVNISDFGEDPTTFFVMEMLEGLDLSGLLEAGPMSWERFKPIAIQAVAALTAAHQAGVIHRDLKPSNIFVVPRDDGSDAVKVLDFGIAKVIDSMAESGGVTRTSEVIGTVSYMAPEQAVAGPVDVRTDVYSMGITMFEVLTGRLPFIGATAFEVMDRHLRAERPSLRDLVPGIPEDLDTLVQRAMAREPDERFQTMAELLEALERIPAIDTLTSTVVGALSSARAFESSVPPTVSASEFNASAAAVEGERLAWRTVALPLLISVIVAAGGGAAAWWGLKPSAGASYEQAQLMLVVHAQPTVANPPRSVGPRIDPSLWRPFDMQSESLPNKDVAKAKPRRRTEHRRSRTRAHTDDDVKHSLVRAGQKQCALTFPVDVEFQVMPSGKVMMVDTSPRNDCIKVVAKRMIFTPRRAPSLMRLKIKPR